MKRLYVFNPENDLALASDSPYFTPPAAALKLARAADVLPVWYAGLGDYVLVSPVGRDWIEHLARNIDFGPDTVTDVPGDVSGIIPWGWSKYVREKLSKLSVPGFLLPSDTELNHIRQCSHRRISIDMYRCLENAGLPYRLPQRPLEIYDVGIISHNMSNGEHMFLKAPLSGSGRGVLDSMSAPERQVLRLSGGMIRHQGSIILEPRLDKKADFAMLYDINHGKCEFKGYSLFFNAGYSTYNGNIIACDDGLRAEIEAYGVPAEWLDATRVAVSSALETCVGQCYNGPLGVDMMIYESAGDRLIAPCVEVNLRMTMGRVARELCDRYVSPGVKGVMRISQSFTGLVADDYSVENGRITGGIVALTPPYGNEFVVTLKIL